MKVMTFPSWLWDIEVKYRDFPALQFLITRHTTIIRSRRRELLAVKWNKKWQQRDRRAQFWKWEYFANVMLWYVMIMLSLFCIIIINICKWDDVVIILYHFYRTQVRSLFTLVTDSLTHSVTFSKLDWCNPGVWRCQLKTCWCCNCCWWGSCWQQFAAVFEAEVWSKS